MRTVPAEWPRRVAVRAWRVGRFAVYFGGQMLRANLTVLWEILRPRRQAAPAILAVPLASRTRREVVTMANLVTLTPGTLTLEVVLDPPTLYVHGMFASDPERFLADLLSLEARLLTALRPVGSR
jgi:multicomponent Na+:H+ antiporter subunit E